MMTGKKPILFSVAMLIVAVLLLWGYMFVISPQAIRSPRLEHAHVRLQLVVNGQQVNFGDAKFQTAKGVVCTDSISEQPIHLHDNKNQFIHLHWKDMTGGLILKNYGWNLIGGPDSTLGYRFDRLPPLNRVPIFGDVLPALPQDATLWVYTGTDSGYAQRAVNDFLWQDMETFFGTKSTIVNHASPGALTSLFFARAAAHEGIDHSAPHNAQHSQEELTQLNNVLGNVVIFAQKDKPTDSQVKDRFAHLEPLAESTCGG